MKKLHFILLSAIFLHNTAFAAEPKHVTEYKRLMLDQVCFLKQFCVNTVAYGGSLIENIKCLELVVEVHEKAKNVDEAKNLFCGLFYDWLAKLNADEKAKPYFSTPAMTADNLEFRLIFADFDTPSTKTAPKIAYAFNQGDKIVYCIREQSTGKLQPYLRESYQELLKKHAKS